MSLDKKDLEARVSKLEKDISTVQQSLVDLEKTRNERIAQLNAMQGAKQQCQIFLKEFKEDNKMQPLLFAGLIIEGGVISYEANLKSGGLGARYLGIGTSKQYREDTVTISLRLVSVSTGEVLIETLVSKSIVSTNISQDIFRFIEAGTELVEVEGGIAENESVSIALQKAVETGILNIIYTGIERGYWEYDEIKINELDCDAECINDIRG